MHYGIYQIPLNNCQHNIEMRGSSGRFKVSKNCWSRTVTGRWTLSFLAEPVQGLVLLTYLMTAVIRSIPSPWIGTISGSLAVAGLSSVPREMELTPAKFI